MKQVLAILFLLNNFCIGQELYYEQFTETDGLPSMMTYEMVQDSHGVLWVGTENGLVSFDGEDFQTYTHPQLIDNDIIEIALDKNGRVYFLNLSDQFGYVEEDVVYIINIDSLDNKVSNIVITDKGCYVKSRNFYEFSQIDKERFSFKKTDVNCFFKKNNQYQEGIITKSKKKYERIKSESYDFEFEYYSQKNYGKSKDNRYFYYGSFYEFIEVDTAVNYLIGKDNFLRYTKSYGKSFLIYNKGVRLYDSKTSKIHSLLKSKSINTVFVDKERNIWLSTRNEGIIKIPHIDFQLSSKFKGYSNNYGINDFVQDDNGNIYLGTTTGQILVYSKNETLIKEISSSPLLKAVSLKKYGEYVYGISDKALIAIHQETLEYEIFVNEQMALKNFIIEKDTFYIGARDGIYKSKLEDFPNVEVVDVEAHILDSYWVNDMHFDDSSQSLYAATSTGLFKIDSSGASRPIFIEGKKEYNVSSILEGKQNSIWIGTRSAGAIKIRNDTMVEKYNVSNGLVSNNVNSLAISDNKLIVSTVNGVGIKDILGNEKRTINELGGVIPKDIFHCDMIDDDYWLSSNSGLSIIKKDQLKYFRKAGPILSIKNIYANGDKIKLEDEIEFSHTVSNIQINLRNVSHQNGNYKSIKFRILPSDTSWQYSKEPVIRFQSLKYGSYNIEAIGLNSLSEEGNKISLSFTISPPWWQTTWAWVAGFIFAIFAIQLIIKYRTQRIRKEEATKRDYLTQINHIKDQALQLQMNPHFIFNSLNAIQNFIGTDEEEMTMNYLARFARLIRLIFEHSKGNTITLEEELEFMNLYLDLEKLRFKEKVKIHVNVDSEIQKAKDLINVPPLLIQPIVENSFKHGLFHKKGDGNLYITYDLEESILNITIEDDGIGREESGKISQQNSEKQVSSGIKTTIERIDLLNFGKDKSLNSVQVEDLFDEYGNASGTKTTLILEV